MAKVRSASSRAHQGAVAPVTLTTYPRVSTRRALAHAGIGALAAATLIAVAVLAFLWVVPPTADATPTDEVSPYYAASVQTAKSTPVDEWEKGSLPHLYTSNAAWADAPFGYFTVGTAGAVPTCLAMAYVQQTGAANATPADFAAFATARELATDDASTASALITQASEEHGMSARAIDATERDIRQALALGEPVIVVTMPDTFASGTSCIVIEGVNKYSELDIVDPTNALRTAESWTFDEITGASAALFALEAVS